MVDYYFTQRKTIHFLGKFHKEHPTRGANSNIVRVANRSSRGGARGGRTKFASIAPTCYVWAIDMRTATSTVTISPKFQVVIPQAIREALHLIPGEKLRVLRHANRVEFIPVRPIQEMRGFLKNMDTNIHREGDRL